MTRVVVITGAAGGIGKATALRFFGRRMRAILIDHPSREHALAELADLARIRAKGTGGADPFGVDVTDRSAVERCVAEIAARHGRIDILVNVAGIIQKLEPLVRTDVDAARRVMDVNYWGTVHWCKTVLPVMRRQGSGRIINVASISAFMGDAGNLIYSGSKAAIVALTRGLAKEAPFNKDGAPHAITVNAVAPGFIETELIAPVSEKMKEAYQRTAAVGRMGKPEEIAEIIYWIATRSPQFLTGSVITADGGFLL